MAASNLSTCLFLWIEIQEIICRLLTVSHNPATLAFLHRHIPLMRPPPLPPSLHWAFVALSLFIPPSLLLAPKGWSVNELAASFIGVSQKPGDKGQPKCHNVSIFCLCADANAWKETFNHLCGKAGIQLRMDGWVQTRGRRRRMGACFVID